MSIDDIKAYIIYDLDSEKYLSRRMDGEWRIDIVWIASDSKKLPHVMIGLEKVETYLIKLRKRYNSDKVGEFLIVPVEETEDGYFSDEGWDAEIDFTLAFRAKDIDDD